jgi:hypothetical protein
MATPIGAMTSYRQGASQNVAYNAAGGASAASTAFGSQTRAIRVCVPGVVAAGSGVRVIVGGGTPTATATSTLLPTNWVEYYIVTPGQKIAVLGNDTVTGNLSVTELS